MAETLEQRHQKDDATLYAMASIYCKGNHPDATRNERGVCPACEEVVHYSLERTAKCPYEHKGVCKDCTIHCYKPDMRAGIKEIMRYGAPRMIYQHPALTAYYLKKKISGRKAAKAERQA